METDRALRFTVARTVARIMRDEEHRDLFYPDGQTSSQVVIALESDTIMATMDRVETFDNPPVILAVCYPETGKVCFATLEPCDPDEPHGGGDVTPVDPKVTLGMFQTYTEQGGHDQTLFRVTKWLEPILVSPFDGSAAVDLATTRHPAGDHG